MLSRVLKILLAAVVLTLIVLAGFVAIAAVAVATLVFFVVAKIFRRPGNVAPGRPPAAMPRQDRGDGVIDVTVTEVPGESSAPRLR